MREIETPRGTARVLLQHALEPRAVLVLGHGAGGSVSAPDLQVAARTALELDMSVALVEQPYRVLDRRNAPPPAHLDEAWVAVLRELAFDIPVIAGGRSSGARVACRTASEVGAVAVLCLAFPLQPPGRDSRLEELDAVEVPVLVVQGKSDQFGVPPPGPRREVALLEGDHGLKKDPDGLGATVRVWLERLL